MLRQDSIKMLKKIGVKSIADRTHLSPKVIEDILAQEYTKYPRYKMLGFIQILEREYSVDICDDELSEDEFGEHEEIDDVAVSLDEKKFSEETGFEDTKEQTQYKNIKRIVYILIAILIAIYLVDFNKEDSEVIETTPIEIVQEPKEVVKVKAKSVVEEIIEVPVEQEKVEVVIPKIVNEKVSILPTYKVWIGIVNLTKGEKKHFTTIDKIELNPKDEYIIVTGHGYFTMFIDSKENNMSSKDAVHLHYDGIKFNEITKEEFTVKNGGIYW